MQWNCGSRQSQCGRSAQLYIPIPRKSEPLCCRAPGKCREYQARTPAGLCCENIDHTRHASAGSAMTPCLLTSAFDFKPSFTERRLLRDCHRNSQNASPSSQSTKVLFRCHRINRHRNRPYCHCGKCVRRSLSARHRRKATAWVARDSINAQSSHGANGRSSWHFVSRLHGPTGRVAECRPEIHDGVESKGCHSVERCRRRVDDPRRVF